MPLTQRTQAHPPPNAVVDCCGTVAGCYCRLLVWYIVRHVLAHIVEDWGVPPALPPCCNKCFCAGQGSGYPLQVLAARASRLWAFRYYPSRIGPRTKSEILKGGLFNIMLNHYRTKRLFCPASG